MAAPRVIDTYPAFLQFWAAARDEPLEHQIERWAGVARVQGDFARAARRCGAAEAILHAIGASLLPADREEYDGTVAALQSALSDGDLAAAWDGGRALSLADAVAEVLPAG